MKKNKNIHYILLEFLLRNCFIYLVFSLIYLDFNPMNWWLLESVWGRFVLVIFEIILFSGVSRSLTEDIEKEQNKKI